MSDGHDVPAATDFSPALSGLYTTEDLARLFHCTPRTIRNWVRADLLRPIRIGGRVYFDPRDIEQLIHTSKR